MKTSALVILIVICAMAIPASAVLQFRLDPCNGDDWNHDTIHTVTVQAMSDAGPVIVDGYEVWIAYKEAVTDSHVGELALVGGSDLRPTSELFFSNSNYAADDGVVNISQYNFFGTGSGTAIDSTGWVDMATFDIEVIGYGGPLNLYQFILQEASASLYVFDPTGAELTAELINCDEGWNPGVYHGDPTAIELVSFKATEVDSQVQLTWETASEKENAGFHLYRSGSENGQYVQITSAMIPAQGDPFTGATYDFTDPNVEVGNTYYYKLEDISLYGVSTFHGPAKITLEDNPIFGCGVVSGNGNATFALMALVLGATLIGARRVSRKGYRKPQVKTTSGDEVIKKLGPAQTCSPTPDTCTTAQ